jgi:hypothetical protein
MITIYTPQGEKLREIPGDDFFKHITAMELLAVHPEFDDTLAHGWSFVKLSNAIRICTGDPEKTIYIPITRDIDVDKFKKHWYLEYCQVQGYSYTVTNYPNEDVYVQ